MLAFGQALKVCDSIVVLDFIFVVNPASMRNRAIVFLPHALVLVTTAIVRHVPYVSMVIWLAHSSARLLLLSK